METLDDLNPLYRDSKKTTAMKWLASIRLNGGIVDAATEPNYSDSILTTYKKILSALTGNPIHG